jgi:hypothetical protein
MQTGLLCQTQNPEESNFTAFQNPLKLRLMKLTVTTACLIRDKLIKDWHNKKITLSQITERLCEYDMPEWLKGQIIEMVEFRQYDRITCPVEQAMHDAVCYHIVCEIKKYM